MRYVESREMRAPGRSLKLPARAAPLVCAMLIAACGGKGAPAIDSAQDVSATLRRYCSDCHNPADLAGNFSFSSLDPSAVQQKPELWEHVVRKLRTRTMPPADEPRPDSATYDALAGWLESSLDTSATPN